MGKHTGESLFLSGLTLLFIYLKLTDKIDWPWWWVVSPLWIPFVVAVFLTILVLLLASSRK